MLNNKEVMMEMTLSTVVTAAPEDIADETKHVYLNKKGFVRGVSAQHQWYLLVNDALIESKLPPNETVRDYLACMLNRFTGRTELLDELASFDYFEHFFGKQEIDATSIQDVADMSLQFVALFPERSRYRHLPRSLDYVTELGISLYRQLARDQEGKEDWFSRAYPVMADSFGYAVILLRSTCSRFAVERTISNAGKHTGDWYIPSDLDAKNLRNTIKHFGLMHFRSSLDHTTKNN